jgi:hypothetical protein
MSDNEFPHMQIVTDEQDYEYLKTEHLGYVIALEKELKSGKTPEQIRDWWGDDYKRDRLARRIFHAARHIQRGLT